MRRKIDVNHALYIFWFWIQIIFVHKKSGIINKYCYGSQIIYDIFIQFF